jgi:molybdopterin converting factor small subunit
MANAHLRILCFGPARECTGSSELLFETNVPCSVGDLRISLLNAYPTMGTADTVRIAVDQAYSTDDRVLIGGEEIAIILPVSGG